MPSQTSPMDQPRRSRSAAGLMLLALLVCVSGLVPSAHAHADGPVPLQTIVEEDSPETYISFVGMASVAPKAELLGGGMRISGAIGVAPWAAVTLGFDLMGIFRDIEKYGTEVHSLAFPVAAGVGVRFSYSVIDIELRGAAVEWFALNWYKANIQGYEIVKREATADTMFMAGVELTVDTGFVAIPLGVHVYMGQTDLFWTVDAGIGF